MGEAGQLRPLHYQAFCQFASRRSDPRPDVANCRAAHRLRVVLSCKHGQNWATQLHWNLLQGQALLSLTPTKITNWALHTDIPSSDQAGHLWLMFGLRGTYLR